MVSEQTRNGIWQDLLDAARLVRYYEALAARHLHQHLLIRMFLLLAAAGGMASLLELLPEYFQLLAGVGVTVLVALDFALNCARKTAVLNLIGIECTALENKWMDLWAKLDRLGEDEALRETDQLARRLAEVTGWAGHAEIREDRALNERCEEVAFDVVASRYAPG